MIRFGSGSDTVGYIYFSVFHINTVTSNKN
jgi:hypothetical protein